MSIEIGKIIQEHRERAALTQGELAAKLGVSQQSVAKWESGKTSPRRQIYPAIIEALNIASGVLEVANWRSRWGSVEDFPVDRIVQAKSVDSAPPTAISASVEHEQGFPDRKSTVGYRTEFKSLLNPLLKKAGQDGRWDVVVRGASTRWSVDYMTDKTVVNFSHAVSPVQLNGLLSVWVRIALWSMVTMRKMSNDPRKFVLVITMPKDMDIDFEQPPQMENLPTNTSLLQRLTAEAAIMDIAIFTARTPAQVASLLTYEEDLDNSN